MAGSSRLIVASLLTMMSSPSVVFSLSNSVGKIDRCGVRLERALDALQRDSPRRNRLEEEEAGIIYHQKLVSAPLEMTVSRIAVKVIKTRPGWRVYVTQPPKVPLKFLLPSLLPRHTCFRSQNIQIYRMNVNWHLGLTRHVHGLISNQKVLCHFFLRPIVTELSSIDFQPIGRPGSYRPLLVGCTSVLDYSLPQDSRNHGNLWARVEQCSYEPSNNALQTRVMFNDLTVSGVVSLVPRTDDRSPIAGESCRMSLRLRRAGIEFYTSPIARARGQMRIRTESSFLEPRFASIYAYGCRPTRLDKQIKRHDKWHQRYQQHHQIPVVTTSADENYEPPEPRQIAALTKEEDIAIANESTRARELHESDVRLGIWRKNVWVTKIPRRRKRRRSIDELDDKPGASGGSKVESSTVVSPVDAIRAFAKRAASNLHLKNTTLSINRINDTVVNLLKSLYNDTDDTKNASNTKTSLKRETTVSQFLYYPSDGRESRDTVDGNFEDPLSEPEDPRVNNWQSRESISNEMEDIFLRGASQALTRYIERELHPAIKETLMLSMGYTISYG